MPPGCSVAYPPTRALQQHKQLPSSTTPSPYRAASGGASPLSARKMACRSRHRLQSKGIRRRGSTRRRGGGGGGAEAASEGRESNGSWPCGSPHSVLPPLHRLPSKPLYAPVRQLVPAHVPPHILLLQPARQAWGGGGRGGVYRGSGWNACSCRPTRSRGSGASGRSGTAVGARVRCACDAQNPPRTSCPTSTMPLPPPSTSPSISHSSSGVAARISTPNHWRARQRAIAQRAATAAGGRWTSVRHQQEWDTCRNVLPAPCLAAGPAFQLCVCAASLLPRWTHWTARWLGAG